MTAYQLMLRAGRGVIMSTQNELELDRSSGGFLTEDLCGAIAAILNDVV